MKRLALLLLIPFIISACQATMTSETFTYTSTYVRMHHWIGEPGKMDYELTLSGNLYLPEGPGPHPVVVWSHPSTRNNPNMLTWKNGLRSGLLANGIGLLINDHYTGRGIGNKANWRKLNTDSRIVDAIRLLAALAEDHRIDAERIGISGASFGANVAKRTQWEYYMEKMLPDGPRYAAHVPIYPNCYSIIKNYRSTGAPMLILIGEKDHTDPHRCVDRGKEMRADGADVEVVVYPNAYHCFIQTSSYSTYPFPLMKHCKMRVLEEGASGISHIFSFDVKRDYPLYKNCYGKYGQCAGNSSAREDALKRTVAFFVKHL